MGKYRLNYWETESDAYLMDSTEQDFDTFVRENEDLWSENFIMKIKVVLSDFHIITENEYRRITLEESACKKLKSLQRKGETRKF
jgi:hypothetical protein